MLASRTVEQVFDRMLARYGSAWRAKWQGINPDAVKADWAEALDGCGWDALAYGLRYLPTDFPPNAAQFAELCRAAPSLAGSAPKQLPMPEVTEAERERVRALLARTRERLTGRAAPEPVRSPEEEAALFEPARLEALKRESARKVAEFARQRGMA